MGKKIRDIVIVVGIILLGVWIALGLRCPNTTGGNLLRDGILSLISPHFDKPSNWSHTEIKPDTIATIHYDSIPDVTHISGGTIFPNGDIELEVQFNDSLFNLLRYNIGGYHGVGHIIIENGMPKIYFPRFGVEWAGFIGPSIHGVNAGLEHIYINNFLGVTHVHPFTPTIELPVWEDSFSLEEDIYIGIGATADLAPRSASSLRVGAAWLWQTSDLKNSRITLSIDVAFP